MHCLHNIRRQALIRDLKTMKIPKKEFTCHLVYKLGSGKKDMGNYLVKNY